MSHAVSPFWGQVPDVILSTILVIGIGTDTQRLQHTISMQTVGWRHPKGQGIVLWSSGCKSRNPHAVSVATRDADSLLLFNVIRVDTTIRLLKGTGKNPNPLGCGSMSNPNDLPAKPVVPDDGLKPTPSPKYKVPLSGPQSPQPRCSSIDANPPWAVPQTA